MTSVSISNTNEWSVVSSLEAVHGLPITIFAFSASADRHHDFERIAVRKLYCVELTAWNDFAIAFKGDTSALEFELFDHACHIHGRRKCP